MKHDLIHVQGKPYVMVPLHEYRMLVTGNTGSTDDVPEDIMDSLYAGQETPLRILRKFRGFTQEELAAEAGLSRPYLTEIETGSKNGSVKAIKMLARALKISPGLLMQAQAA